MGTDQRVSGARARRLLNVQTDLCSHHTLIDICIRIHIVRHAVIGLSVLPLGARVRDGVRDRDRVRVRVKVRVRVRVRG